MLRFVAVLVLASMSLAARAQDPALIGQIEAKGMKLKKDPTGNVLEVFFSSVPMAPEDYRVFGKFPHLRRIWMAPGEPFPNDQSLSSLGTLPKVEIFFCGTNHFTDDGLKVFRGWKSLKSFGMDHWFGPPDTKAFLGKGMNHLADLPLEAVRLGGCRVDNEAPKALAKIKTLQKVDLFHTFAVTDDGIKELKALPKLKTIILGPQYTPRITNRTLEHLSHIPSLEEISITETWFTYDDGLIHLKKLPNLKSLKLKFVMAEEKDLARLKNEMPALTVELSPPEEMNAAKLKRTFKDLLPKR